MSDHSEATAAKNVIASENGGEIKASFLEQQPDSGSAPACEQPVARSNYRLLSIGFGALVLLTVGAVWFNIESFERISDKLAYAQRQVADLARNAKAAEEKKNHEVLELDRDVHALEQRLDELTKVVADKIIEKQEMSQLDQAVPVLEKRLDELSKVVEEKIELQKQSIEHKRPAPRVELVEKKLVISALNKPALKEPVDRPKSHNRWAVNLSSTTSSVTATRELASFMRAGLNAEYVEVLVKGVTWYRVRVSGFRNQKQAVAYKNKLVEMYGYRGLWHSKL